MEAITAAFTSLGFPVACVAVLGWFIYKYIQKIENNNSTREAKLMEMLGHCQGKLSEITTVLDRLCSEINEMRLDIKVNQDKEERDEEN